VCHEKVCTLWVKVKRSENSWQSSACGYITVRTEARAIGKGPLMEWKVCIREALGKIKSIDILVNVRYNI